MCACVLQILFLVYTTPFSDTKRKTRARCEVTDFSDSWQPIEDCAPRLCKNRLVCLLQALRMRDSRQQARSFFWLMALLVREVTGYSVPGLESFSLSLSFCIASQQILKWRGPRTFTADSRLQVPSARSPVTSPMWPGTLSQLRCRLPLFMALPCCSASHLSELLSTDCHVQRHCRNG